MISFFKITAIYKFFFLFLLFVLIRIPSFLYPLPLTNQELTWMLVGEKMAEGFALYTEIWDSLSPLSSLIYALLHLIFGKSLWLYHFLGAVLVFMQAIFFNNILINREVYHERTMLPALAYIVLMSLFLDYFTFSPILIANTFILWVINLLFIQMNEKRRSDSFFAIGVYLGLATLFYLPYFVMLIAVFIALSLYTPTNLQGYLAISFAFFFSLIIVFLVFYLTDGEYDFFISFFSSVFPLQINWDIDIIDFLILITFPTIMLIASFVVLSSYNRYTNYQNRCQNVMFIWVIVASFSFFINAEFRASNFIILIPALVFLFGHYFLLLKNILLQELMFLFLFVSVLFWNYDSIYNLGIYYRADYQPILSIESMIAKPTVDEDILKNKKILVLGDSYGNYQYGRLATPYLNRQLADRHFEHLDKYNILVSIYRNFETDAPDVIIDEDGLAQKIFESLPLIGEEYEKQGDSNVYLRK